jgi:hypothetical protein
METPIATVGQAYDGRPVVPRCRLLRFLLGGVGLGLHRYSLPWCSCPISISLAASSTSSILYIILQLYYQEGSGVATLRLGLRVVIGAQQETNMFRLQSLAHHAHRVLAQPVQVGLLVQEPWR